MIYEKVAKLAAERGLTISRLEKECGLGNMTIVMWRTSSPRVSSLKKVADYLNVPIAELLEDDNDKSKS